MSESNSRNPSGNTGTSSHQVERSLAPTNGQSQDLPIPETLLDFTSPNSVLHQAEGSQSLGQASAQGERASFVPETFFPESAGATVGGGAFGGGYARARGDGTMEIDGEESGPSSVLQGIAQAASNIINPIVDSILPALEGVLPTSMTNGNGALHPSEGSSSTDRTAGSSAVARVSSAQAQSPFITAVAGSSSSRPSSASGTHDDLTVGHHALASSIRAESPAPIPRPRTFRTGYIYDARMMLHCVDGYEPTEDSLDWKDDHPEDPVRIKRIFNRLRDAGLVARMKKLDFRQVSYEQVMLVHSEDHWAKVEGTQGMSSSPLSALCAENREES